MCKIIEILKEKKDLIIEIFGWIGTFCLLGAYFFTTLYPEIGKITINSLNLFGSFTLIIICYRQKNWQLLLVNVFWFIISIINYFI